MPDVNEEKLARQADETASATRPPRKYVLLADGTGNAFSTQESNVWRLYEALDRTKPDQVAFYIKGVGTSGFAPFAKLDGATGIGVPSNVRKLYRFLCWNWQPGDEIYIFGFSRGAFTARTLAALIASQGLVPSEIDGKTVDHPEMQRNAMAAWREYRRGSVPWYKTLPTIWITRILRDILLAAYHAFWRHRSYGDVREKMDGRTDVPIKFLGLFDTVEAYGVPVEELRTAIDWAIWPISFRNRVLSHKVERARHALALDDERTTFHPLRFDQSKLRDADQIKEVWFAGVHSDVGGGYPDGTLSYVPLVWMAEQVRGDLRFQDGTIEHFKEYQSSIGPMHDSRSGAAVFYRYGPRPIGESDADGGAPVVHLSVVERMLHGCDNYAPVMLPASAKVQVNGNVLPLTAPATRGMMKSAYQRSKAGHDGAAAAAAADAFESMRPPNEAVVQQVLDTVWWRRFAYFSLLASAVFIAAGPWIAMKVVRTLSGPTDGVSFLGVTALDVIRKIDYGVGAVVGSTAKLLQAFLPSYFTPWFDIAVYYPFATTLVGLLLYGIWRLNSFLRDRIQERARLAWDRPGRKVSDIGKPSAALTFARLMRLYGGPVRFTFAKVLLPLLFLAVIFSLTAVALGRSYFNWRNGVGLLCSGAGGPTPVMELPLDARGTFDTSSPCWASGLIVEKGRKYRIWITVKEPWFDRSIMTGATGFQHYGLRHLTALPLRRKLGAAWFQPVVRIGAEGADEIALQEINGLQAEALPRTARDAKGNIEDLPMVVEDMPQFKGRTLTYGNFEKLPEAALPEAQTIWRDGNYAEQMVADFIAPESGEVFLYVNDALQVLPFLGPYALFYQNNRGTAEVRLQREPLPKPQSRGAP